MESYFNTTDIKDPVDQITRAKSQEDTVLELFEKTQFMSASQVHSHFPKNIPLTSVRRAMSVLVKKTKLFKTDKVRIGIYGDPEKISEQISGFTNSDTSFRS